MKKKPTIIYVDDEPHNLTIFEASLPTDWDIKMYQNPLEALQALEKVVPYVVVADQRMPAVSGVHFLELTRKLYPDAIRIIVTGYSDEDLVIESVRRAQIFDYIRKPWDTDDLRNRLEKGIEFYNIQIEKRDLVERLTLREKELSDLNLSLVKVKEDLERVFENEKKLRHELENWVSPYVLWALRDKELKFPMKQDLVGVTFDIVKSSEIHGILIEGKPLRSLVLQAFTEAVIRHGGCRESHSGDSAYAHFGLVSLTNNPYESALAVAREFRVALRGIAKIHKVNLECGLALHVARDCTVDVHTVQLNTPRGIITQKSFDTTSNDVDLLHRMEKLVHQLPGSSVILSEDFVKELDSRPPNLVNLGPIKFKGVPNEIHCHLIPSDLLSAEALQDFKEGFQRPGDERSEVAKSKKVA